MPRWCALTAVHRPPAGSVRSSERSCSDWKEAMLAQTNLRFV